MLGAGSVAFGVFEFGEGEDGWAQLGGRLIVVGAAVAVEERQGAARDQLPVGRIGVCAIAVQAFQAHARRHRAVRLRPKVFVLEDIAPVKAGMGIGLGDADLDIAVDADAFVAEIFGIEGRLALLELGARAVGVIGHGLALVVGNAALLVVAGAAGHPAFAFAQAVEVRKRDIVAGEDFAEPGMGPASDAFGVLLDPGALVGRIGDDLSHWLFPSSMGSIFW